MINIFAIDAHPAADVLPMLKDDELDDLAADIREYGLREKLFVWTDADGEAWLLDGRNRLKACERAGVEPKYSQASSDQIPDPYAFVRSKNLRRRSLHSFQIAIAWYLLGGSDNKLSTREAANIGGFNREYSRMAKSIVEHSESLAKKVLNAETPIRQAYATVERGKAKSATETSEAPPQDSGRPSESDSSRDFAEQSSPSKAQSAASGADASAPRRPGAEARSDSGLKARSASLSDAEFRKLTTALGMLASIRTDPSVLVRDHGDPAKWKYFRKAVELLDDFRCFAK